MVARECQEIMEISDIRERVIHEINYFSLLLRS
jgi:hypothetical protein